MSPLLVVVVTPDTERMVEMFLDHDDELVKALELQRLDESFGMARRLDDTGVLRFTIAPLDLSTSSN